MLISYQIADMKKHEKHYMRMTEMVDEGLDMVKSSKWVDLGSLLNETWQLKKQLSEYITTPVIDGIYDTAIKAGAVGGKLLGGGGGGFILFVAELDKQESIKKALDSLDCVPFKFEQEGTKVIYND